MKPVLLFLAGSMGFALNPSRAGDAPQGSLLELHSCEVYAGGCVVSSEAPQDGRYMLQAWDFKNGRFNGADLRGLQLAVLQFSPGNLAEPDSKSGQAVIYLPQNATAEQRNALVAWLKSSQPDFHPTRIQTRVEPLKFARSGSGCAFSAGSMISVEVASLDSCPTGGCGESLWYQPRAATSLFTVAVNRSSQIAEPLLQLKWEDAGKRSVFLARFGEANRSLPVYVTLTELCGPLKSLF